jgi:hypothetical protein
MKTKDIDREMHCAAIVGEFVFGPLRCEKPTTLVELETGDSNPVCEKHAKLPGLRKRQGTRLLPSR